MARTILDAQIQEISAGITKLGSLVVTALEQTLQALQSGDQALCTQVVEADKTINDLRYEVERLTFRALTLQQPLAGRDLRFLSSVPSMTANLERMGDNAAGIAKLLMLMAPRRSTETSPTPLDSSVGEGLDQTPLPDQMITEHSITSELFDLGQEACQIVRGTIHAFEQGDAPAARKVWQEDDVVDVRYHQVRHHLTTMLTGTHAIAALQQDTFILMRMTYWFWIAHNLERVGDHCTNICERIVFFLEGDTTIKPIEAE